MTGEGPETELARQLLVWYERNGRSLPWRNTSDPYAIVVSEFMLHQTRVQTVLAYYEGFLERFPNWDALAGAALDEVLKAWEGMGYYARARNLHTLARRICSEYGAQLPDRPEALRKLPGVGPYTEGAILSIIFGQDIAAIDGNVRRVLCRAFDIREDPTRGSGKRRIEALAAQLLPPGQAGAFNQALMDLGATVCTSRGPSCEDCPWQATCLAHAAGSQELLPVRMPRGPLQHHDIAAGVIWHEGRILIARRPEAGLLGGLWEFPGGKQEPGETLEGCLVREVGEELDIEVTVEQPLCTVRHAYTHFRITLHAFHCAYVRGEPRAVGCSDWQWVLPDQLSSYAFPAANHAILKLLAADARAEGPAQANP
jgi:A/G-specific adenine glycosylase